jgi:hypothetical protein
MRCLTPAFLILSALSAHAQDICSLVVRAVTPDGRRVGAPISVTEMSGRTEDRDPSEEDARFCDLGILPVTVNVGSEGLCNQVTVRNVPVDPENTYLLQVTYDPLACRERPAPPPIPICSILFRVADRTGKWIPGAEIAVASPGGDHLVTDQFGRALFFAERGTEVIGSAAAEGYKTSSFHWRCSILKLKHEEVITLSR